ncbi:MAG: CCA tRNA nucleotidyltransferase [Terracidiphilus sp.]|jgi:tRNA nucleotidyltransferase/poly(A) polymerase
MPDYIYLLENRLSTDQQNALRRLREAAQEASTILFLTGDAVRDLTSGHAVRELEVVVHGNALKLKKTIEKLGGNIWGEDEASRSLYLCFAGTVRVDLISAHRTEYPKPGQPVYHPASIQEDLRRRDFTVNAMAISLNEGSFGLLMDPMNGAADIESRTLRLVSNYGFLEEPSLLIRATRYMTRLGWEMDPKTQKRYENAVEEGVIDALSAQARSQELEQIGHEEDGLKVLQALEAAGWMKVLFPAWTAAKADEERLTALHDLAVELMVQGVHPDMSAGQMRLLTAKLTPKDLAALKKLMLRPGFVEEWNSLDSLAEGFAKKLLAKENATPSVSYKLFTSYDPEAILWLGFTSKDAAVKERFNLFLKAWPEVRQRIPHALLQEMRITAELPAYSEIVQSVFLELLDGRLATPEEAKAFLEPHSPPAPPPQVTIKRPRAKRGSEAKLKDDSFDDEDESEDCGDEEEDLDDIGGEEDDLEIDMHLPKVALEVDLADEEDEDDDEDLDHEAEAPEPAPKRAAKTAAATKSVAQSEKLEEKVPAAAAAKAAKDSATPAAKKPTVPVKTAPAKTAPVKAAPVKASPAKATPAPKKEMAKVVAAKEPVKTISKPASKTPAKPAGKAAVKPPSKPAAKSPAKAPAGKAASAKKKVAATVKPQAAKGVIPSKSAANKAGVKKIVSKSAKKR